MSRGVTRRAAWGVALAAAALATSSVIRCASPSAAPPAAPPPSRSHGLVAAIASATVECAELSALQGEIESLPPESTLLQQRFGDATSTGEWLEGREILDPAARALRSVVVDPGDQQRSLLIPELAAGLHRVVTWKGGESLVVLARLRAVAPSGPRPRLSVLALEEAPKGADVRRSLLDARRSKPARAGDASRPAAELTVDAGPGQEWQLLRLLVPRDPRRRAIRISVSEGSGVLLRELVVGLASPSAEIGLSRRRPGAGMDHPLVARVRRDEVDQDSLLLPSGTRVRFRLPISDVRPRLDAAIASHPVAATRNAVVTLAVDGKVVSSRATNATLDGTASGAGWTGWSIPLGEWAGRTVTLELSSAGDPGAVAVLGDPWLLAGATPRAGPNLLLVSIDTLRADAIGCYGSRDTRTPAMDALAKSGACFRNATSPASYTLPAHATMLTGQHPLVHGVTSVGGAVLDPSRSLPLAVALQRAGWQTAAFTGGGLVHPDFGFGQGFDRYGVCDVGGVRRIFQERAADLDEAGARFVASQPLFDWLGRRSDQPFFLFLHTYFVHNYVPSADFAARHAATHRPNLLLASGAEPHDLVARMKLAEQEAGASEGLRRLYRAAVDEVDARLIGPLVAELHRLGIGERTIVAIVSDHGDEFQEHGGLFHGRALWNELVHVPFVLRGPGIPSGVVRDDRVQLEDLAPTLAARLGVPHDEQWTGRDLLAAHSPEEIVEPEAVPRLLHLDHRDLLGVYQWEGLLLHGHALLRHQSGEGATRDYLFDVRSDPTQRDDVASRRPSELAALGRRLDAEMEALRQRAAAAMEHRGESSPGDGEDAELGRRLRELGYGIK